MHRVDRDRIGQGIYKAAGEIPITNITWITPPNSKLNCRSSPTFTSRTIPVSPVILDRHIHPLEHTSSHVVLVISFSVQTIKIGFGRTYHYKINPSHLIHELNAVRKKHPSARLDLVALEHLAPFILPCRFQPDRLEDPFCLGDDQSICWCTIVQVTEDVYGFFRTVMFVQPAGTFW